MFLANVRSDTLHADAVELAETVDLSEKGSPGLAPPAVRGGELRLKHMSSYIFAVVDFTLNCRMRSLGRS